MADASGKLGLGLREQFDPTFAAAIFPYCAFFPVSLLVFAFSTAATGTCMVLLGRNSASWPYICRTSTEFLVFAYVVDILLLYSPDPRQPGSVL